MDTATEQGSIVRADEGRVVELGSLRIIYKVTSDQTDDRLGIYELTLAPRTIGATPHLHRVLTEVFQVTTGVLDVLVGTREVSAGAGDLIRVPPNTVHAFANRSEAPVTFLLTFTPALRREGFFEDLAALHEAGRMSDEAAVLDVFNRFDQEVAEGPPGWTRGTHSLSPLRSVWHG